MKQILLTSLLIFGSGCQSAPKITGDNSAFSSVCSEQPSIELKRNDVTEITALRTTAIQSGKLFPETPQGYTFWGELGQTLIYEVSEDICIWIFAPNNQLLIGNNIELDQEGKYVVQITPRIGSKDFELALTLKSPQSPEEFIEIYYDNINDSNYSESWQLLTTDFKNNLNYRDYQRWWNRVQKAEINGIDILNQTEDSAVAKVNLSYRMSNGNLVQDKKPFFHLAWDEDKSHWLIAKKTSSR